MDGPYISRVCGQWADLGMPWAAAELKMKEILLAKSPGQNPCGKICSQHGAKLDENGTSTLTNSTIIQSIGSVCRLVVISPTVSLRFSGSGTAPDRSSAAPSSSVGRGAPIRIGGRRAALATSGRPDDLPTPPPGEEVRAALVAVDEAPIGATQQVAGGVVELARDVAAARREVVDRPAVVLVPGDPRRRVTGRPRCGRAEPGRQPVRDVGGGSAGHGRRGERQDAPQARPGAAQREPSEPRVSFRHSAPPSAGQRCK